MWTGEGAYIKTNSVKAWLVLAVELWYQSGTWLHHCSDVIISSMASQITDNLFVCPTCCSDAHQRKHQSSTSLAFVSGNRRPVDSPHKGPVTRKRFPLDDVIMRGFSVNYSVRDTLRMSEVLNEMFRWTDNTKQLTSTLMCHCNEALGKPRLVPPWRH